MVLVVTSSVSLSAQNDTQYPLIVFCLASSIPNKSLIMIMKPSSLMVHKRPTGFPIAITYHSRATDAKSGKQSRVFDVQYEPY